MTEYKDIPRTFPPRDGGHNQYIDSDGCGHDSKEDFIQCGILGFCACGQPGENLGFLLDVLAFLEWNTASNPGGGPTHDAWWKDREARLKVLFGQQRIEYFMFYWLDVSGLTEHGGAVPGWLTDNGKNLLALLREWKANPT